jgi:hypothetical protein
LFGVFKRVSNNFAYHGRVERIAFSAYVEA